MAYDNVTWHTFGTLFVVVGAVRLYAAQQQIKATEFMPTQTIETLKQDADVFTQRGSAG